MKIFRKLFFETFWVCKYRLVTDDVLSNDRKIKTKWFSLKTSSRYWCADPFLAREGNDYYVFCEMADRYKSRGVLGIGKLNLEGNTKIKPIYDFGYHISYPNVFKYKKEWYMIMETSSKLTIDIYKAVEFPYKWEKVKTLFDNIHAVDTTVFEYDDVLYLFVWSQKNKKDYVNIGKLKINKDDICCELIELKEYIEDIGRPGGNIIIKDDKMFRPTQYGINYYGEKLVFREFKYDLDNHIYDDKVIKELYPSYFNEKKTYRSLHTYNFLDGVEIIDLNKEKFYLLRPLLLMIKKIFR